MPSLNELTMEELANLTMEELAAMPLSSALVAHYPMTDADGGTTIAAAVGGNATYNGGTIISQPGPGGLLSKSVRIQAGDSISFPELTFAGEFTMSAWVKRLDGNQVSKLFLHDTNATNSNVYQFYQLVNSAELFLKTVHSGGAQAMPDSVDTLEWHLWTFTRNASNQVRVFTDTTDRGIAQTAAGSCSWNLMGSVQTDMLLADVRFYNEALSASDVEALYALTAALDLSYRNPVSNIAGGVAGSPTNLSRAIRGIYSN